LASDLRLSSQRTIPFVAAAFLGSLGLWTLLSVVFPPAAQDFPLNDDWAFARGAFLFARGQGIHYSGWASMPQLGQWLWSWPFLMTLGETHFSLRLSTIVLGWLGLAAFYDLLRQGGCGASLAGFLTACLAFNPLFLLLQGTYMTDVPALAFALAALALYQRALAGGQWGWLAGAATVALAGVLTRQNTLAVPLVAAVLLARAPQLRTRPLWLAGVLAPALAGLAVHRWFQARPDVRPIGIALPPPAAVLALPFIVVHFAGLTALPALPLVSALPWKRWATAAVLLGAGALYWLLYGRYLPFGGLFPYSENMLTPWGAFAGSAFTGPLVPGIRPLVLDWTGRTLLTIAGCGAGAVMLVLLGSCYRCGRWRDPLLLFTLVQVPLLLLVKDFYDRYMLFLLPGCLYAVGCQLVVPPRRWWPSFLLLAASAGLSLGLMHDWLAWNRARWELGRRALERHIHPWEIEGGVEWDGWFAPEENAEEPSRQARRLTLPFTDDWFPHVAGRYALSFSQLSGTQLSDSEPYALWLAPGQRRFFLVRLGSEPLPSAPRRRARE
jgi:hypothetical protein